MWARGKQVSLPGFQALPSVYRKKSLEATHHPNPEAPGKQLLPERKQVPTGFIFLLLASVRRNHTLTPISSSPPSHLYPRSHITPNPISCSPYAPSLTSPYMGVRSRDGLEPEGTRGHTWFCSPRGAWKEGISGRCLPRQVGTWPSLS